MTTFIENMEAEKEKPKRVRKKHDKYTTKQSLIRLGAYKHLLFPEGPNIGYDELPQARTEIKNGIEQILLYVVAEFIFPTICLTLF